MKYLVTGKNVETGQMVSPEHITQVLEKGIILNLDVYNSLGFKIKIMPNGTPKTKTGVAIVDGESPKEVQRKFESSPTWCQVNWTVTPIDNF
jgi:hypothetical protein